MHIWKTQKCKYQLLILKYLVIHPPFYTTESTFTHTYTNDMKLSNHGLFRNQYSQLNFLKIHCTYHGLLTPSDWVVETKYTTPCLLVVSYRRFGGVFCLYQSTSHRLHTGLILHLVPYLPWTLIPFVLNKHWSW